MARRVFFSFHYQEDIWRANIVRNSWRSKDWEKNTPIDNASWETLKRSGDAAVKKWIDNQLYGCGVTVVLIGQHTYQRKFVLYELRESFALGKGILGIRIHRLKNRFGETSRAGINPLSRCSGYSVNFFGWRIKHSFDEMFQTYDWVNDNGYVNFKSWVEEAAYKAGR